MALRRIPGVRGVSVKEARALSQLSWVRAEALSTRLSEARVLPDGRVLLYLGEGERGTLFPSRAALEEVRRAGEELVANGNTIDLTRTLLPPVADFLRDVEAHAESLGARLRVPDEALDRTEASLDAVDNALRRMRKAKQMTPEIVTPLVAYVGQVMLRPCEGRWTTAPTTRKEREPVYDPAEWAAFETAWRAASGATARKELVRPKPIRFEVIDVPISGNENEPMILARDERLLQPFALVVLPMVEPSRRIPLRAAVSTTLIPYRPG
jgi:hypothetical protein